VDTDRARGKMSTNPRAIALSVREHDGALDVRRRRAEMHGPTQDDFEKTLTNIGTVRLNHRFSEQHAAL
jgi:outer membrane receptor for monomeric catechols